MDKERGISIKLEKSEEPKKEPKVMIIGMPFHSNSALIASAIAILEKKGIHHEVVSPERLEEVTKDLSSIMLESLDDEMRVSEKLEEMVMEIKDTKIELPEPFFDKIPSRRAKRIKLGKTKKKGEKTHNKYATRNKFRKR